MSFETENKVVTVHITEKERDWLVAELKRQASYEASPDRGLGPDYAAAAAYERRWNDLDAIKYFTCMPADGP